MVGPPTEVGAVVAGIEPLPPLDQLESMWRDLEARAEPSFFLSWYWIGTWLAESGAHPRLLVVRRNDVIVGLALIGQDCPRFGPLRLPRIHLNQAGKAELDCVCIEYNDLLVDRTIAKATRAAALGRLAECSALELPAVARDALGGIASTPGAHACSERYGYGDTSYLA